MGRTVCQSRITLQSFQSRLLWEGKFYYYLLLFVTILIEYQWKILKKLLKFWHENGDKVLIFSHSVRLLKMLQHLFQHTSYNVSFLSGSMPNEDRQKTVDDFNSDPKQFVFLISTKAGGKHSRHISTDTGTNVLRCRSKHNECQ